MKNKYCIERYMAIFVVYFTIFSYIVFGNALTFNFADRLPLKFIELFSVFIFIFYFIYSLIKKIKYKISFKFLGKWFNLWLIVGFLSATINILFLNYSMSQYIYGILYIFRLIHILLLIKVIVEFIKYENLNKDKLVDFIILCFLIVCFIGFFQLIFYPIAIDWYNLFYKIGVYWPSPDPHEYRLISTYFDPNYLASILVIPFFIQLCRLIFIKNSYKKNIYLVLTLLIFLITFFLTNSRSGIVGLAIGIITIAVFFGYKRKVKPIIWILIILAIPCVLGIILFSNISVFERIFSFANDPSAQHRFDSWKITISYFINHPILGIGYNMFGAFQENQGIDVVVTTGFGVDSSVLFIFLTTGIIGGSLFIYGMVKILKKYNVDYLDIAYKAIILASIIVSFFNNLLFNVLWIFPIALIGNLLKKDDSNKIVFNQEE